ncbi:MAG: FGGY-family carbohydrate kinase [Gammaproteobacteria bacterium]|nr:FGGY-family carbohydrate kinase [Gammaproteobacteria bacterium]
MPTPDSLADLYLGIDLGTSGCRAAVIAADGTPVTATRTDLPAAARPAARHSEQAPEDWWRATVDVVHGIAPDVRARIRVLAVAGTSSTLLLCTADGTPLTPALMYDDTRSLAAADRIAALAPTDSPARGPGSALAKLLYLLATVDAPADARALHQADWVCGRLRGRFDTSDENNCLKLGFDPLARAWPAWMEATGVPRTLLPNVVPVGTTLGRIDPTAAGRLGLDPRTRVVSGTTDSNAAALAAGIERSGDAVTSLGSTLVLKVLGGHPVAAARFGVYSHRIGERWLVGGASNSGGAVLRQFFSDAELIALSARIDPERASGLDYYPLPATGERFPFNDPDLAPRLTPRPADPVRFLHGLLDGIAAIEARGYRLLAELGAPYPRRVLTSGGGAVNETWRRIRARALGVPVTQALHGEAAHGCALLAARAATGD